MDAPKKIAFVVFGATGDLSQRKIMPALCALFRAHTVPPSSLVVAYSRRPWGDSEYRAFIESSLENFSPKERADFLESVQYVQGTFDAESFQTLQEKIKGYDALYHVAVQPEFYTRIIEEMGQKGFVGKVLLEKPFGHDGASALALESEIEKYFPRENIFRVDHYLAKSGLAEVMNLKKEITAVTCRIIETLDISGRGEFYDATGALRDVGQNHLLEMLAQVLMDKDEAQVSLVSARARALEQLAIIPGSGVRGQYEGYVQEKGVEKDSQTETYFKIQLVSTSAHWQDTAITLEAGKALGERKSEIEITFSDGSVQIFAMDISGGREAYEVLLGAALRGEREHFVSMPEVVASWRCAEGIEKELRTHPLQLYKKGAKGLTLV